MKFIDAVWHLRSNSSLTYDIFTVSPNLYVGNVFLTR